FVGNFGFPTRIPKLRTIGFWVAAAILLAFVLVVKKSVGASNAISNTAMIILTLLAVRNLPARLAEHKLTNWGKFSYSIYVYHYALIAIISFVLIEWAAIYPSQIRSYFAWMAFVAPVLLACYALYFVAERPSNDYLRNMR